MVSMGRRVFLLSMMAVTTLVAADEQCNEDALANKRTEFTNCTGEYSLLYHERLTEADIEDATCNLFNKLVGECTKIFDGCYTSEELRSLKNIQMEGLLSQYVATGKVTLEDCSIVKQYRESNVQETEGSRSGCSDRQAVQSQAMYQRCSYSTTTVLYEKIQAIEGSEEIAKLLCDGLANITRECPPNMANCFAPEDIQQMHVLQLAEIKDRLIQAAEGKLGNNSLSDCSVPTDYYYDVYAYEEYDINKEENQKKLQEIMSEMDMEADEDDYSEEYNGIDIGLEEVTANQQTPSVTEDVQSTELKTETDSPSVSSGLESIARTSTSASRTTSTVKSRTIISSRGELISPASMLIATCFYFLIFH